jgi:hypothetical protein
MIKKSFKLFILLLILSTFSSCHWSKLDKELSSYFQLKNKAFFEKHDILFVFHINECGKCIDHVLNEIANLKNTNVGLWVYAPSAKQGKIYLQNKVPAHYIGEVYIDEGTREKSNAFRKAMLIKNRSKMYEIKADKLPLINQNFFK